MLKNVETLFVYCNAQEHVVMGDVMAPLLCIDWAPGCGRLGTGQVV